MGSPALVYADGGVRDAYERRVQNRIDTDTDRAKEGVLFATHG